MKFLLPTLACVSFLALAGCISRICAQATNGTQKQDTLQSSHDSADIVRRKVQPSFLKLLEEYESREPAQVHAKDAEQPYIGDSIVAHFRHGKVFVIILSKQSPDSVASLVRSSSGEVIKIIKSGPTTATASEVPPDIVESLALLSCVDSVYSTLVDLTTMCPAIEHRDAVDAALFFPLAVGDQWCYAEIETGPGKESLEPSPSLPCDTHSEIVSSRQIYGNTYFLELTQYTVGTNRLRRIDSVYYAVSGPRVLAIPASKITDSASVKTYLDFSIPVGAGRVVCGMPHKLVESARLKNDSMITLVSWNPGWMDSGSERTFKRGIGLVESHGYSLASGILLVRWVIR